jgi:hypothetical protein
VPEERGPTLSRAFRVLCAVQACRVRWSRLTICQTRCATWTFTRSRRSRSLANCQQRSAESDTVLDWLRLLAQRRAEVSTSEISRHPRGHHILEDPGRVVFPVTQPPPVSAALALTSVCQVR